MKTKLTTFMVQLVLAGALFAQNAARPAPEVQQIIDQLKARGVQIQGDIRVIQGQALIVNENGIQIRPAQDTKGAAAATEPPPAALHWRNGESLSGDLEGVKDGTLFWKSPLFTGPLALDMAALKSVDFPAAAKR